jgi:SsrA-binding protein
MTPIVNNKKARFDYETLEKFTAGIELTGQEVKSARAGHVNLVGSYVSIRGGEAFLMGADIPPYQPNNVTGNAPNYDPTRVRKLLLSKAEILELSKAEHTKGLTIVPLSVYNKGRFLKVDIAVAKGKKKFDKRESIKKRDVERDLKRSLKN